MASEDDKAPDGAAEDAPTAPGEPAADPEGVEVVEEFEPGDAPKVDFATFVLSLATNALMALQLEGTDERVPGGRIDLKAAAQHIDILAMLEEKTSGNLSQQEQDLLQSLLYDLRMHYIEVAKRR